MRATILSTIMVLISYANNNAYQVDEEIAKKIFYPKSKKLSACENCPDFKQDTKKELLEKDKKEKKYERKIHIPQLNQG